MEEEEKDDEEQVEEDVYDMCTTVFMTQVRQILPLLKAKVYE